MVTTTPSTSKRHASISLRATLTMWKLECSNVLTIMGLKFSIVWMRMILCLIRLLSWTVGMQRKHQDFGGLSRRIILPPVVGEWGRLIILTPHPEVTAICWIPWHLIHGRNDSLSITQRIFALSAWSQKR